MCCNSEGRLSRATKLVRMAGMMDGYFGHSRTERRRRLSLCEAKRGRLEDDVDGIRSEAFRESS